MGVSPEQITAIRSGLLARFECDAALGVRSLPVRIGGGESAEASMPARPPVSGEEIARRTQALQVIDNDEVKGCVKCGLHATRTKTVFGIGSSGARIMFVGEAPGHDEDKSGEPFVGRAGQLLTDMIQKGMGLKREEVFICNVLKCRPPDNRTPATDEIAACKDYLWRQIEIVAPEVIVALGAPATQTLLNTREGIGRLRGRWHEFRLGGLDSVLDPEAGGMSIPLLATFHPAYLLRSPGEKAKSWADLKMVMARLSIPVPARR
jgi:DNA polymerase